MTAKASSGQKLGISASVYNGMLDLVENPPEEPEVREAERPRQVYQNQAYTPHVYRMRYGLVAGFYALSNPRQGLDDPALLNPNAAINRASCPIGSDNISPEFNTVDHSLAVQGQTSRLNIFWLLEVYLVRPNSLDFSRVTSSSAFPDLEGEDQVVVLNKIPIFVLSTNEQPDPDIPPEYRSYRFVRQLVSFHSNNPTTPADFNQVPDLTNSLELDGARNRAGRSGATKAVGA